MPIQLEMAKCHNRIKDEYWDDNNEWIAEAKLDGSRYLWHIENDRNYLTSRRISVKTGQYVEKSDCIPHLRDLKLKNFKSTIILDGEIMVPNSWEKISSSVTSIVGSLPERAIELQEEHGYLEYHIFDILFYEGEDCREYSLSKRQNFFKAVYYESYLFNNQYIKLIESTMKDKKLYYEKIVKDGGEGVVLKNLNSIYGKDWIKVKKEETWDVVIIGYKDAKEYTEKVSGEKSISKFYERGWIGAIEFGQYKDGNLNSYGYCSGMTEDVRAEISNNKEKYIGQTIEMKAQQRLKSGHFRHPVFVRFRQDKSPEECIYE